MCQRMQKFSRESLYTSFVSVFYCVSLTSFFEMFRLSVSVKKGELSQKRAIQAAKWVDKEIRKLMEAIEKYGKATGVGDQIAVTYGILFKHTQNVFEALSGTLRTAKKHKIVSFDSEVLFQGTHDHIVITLLTKEMPKSNINTYTYRQVRQCSSRRKLGKAFGETSLQSTNSKCHICKKTVYPMEFVGASDLAFHKMCFKCVTCKRKLSPSEYSTVNNQFYCRVHYEQAFKAKGGMHFNTIYVCSLTYCMYVHETY
eukprot:m.131222 g.131222  ORF g.131222 m.131222 type:complete len:256 (-) comp13071_c0_seq3:506-1273(-)